MRSVSVNKDRLRFWVKVDKTETCWNWVAAQSQGYGRFKLAGRMELAHRIAWEWARGPIPEKAVLDHICGNTRCVRPDHLRAVTVKQNIEHRTRLNANNSTGVRGVTYSGGAYIARVGHKGKILHGGRFATLAEAAARAAELRAELFTHDDAVA